MAYRALDVSPLTPRIGAEISGVDLARPLDDAAFAEVHRALLEHQVLFFRDQALTLEQHKAFGRRFGELAIHPGLPGPEGHPEILVIHADATSTRIAGEKWHSDVSCDPEPPMGSILRLHTVPPSGGDTLFASMYAAYEALSASMQAFLAGLTATHDGEIYRGRYADRGVDDAGKVFPTAAHPVVRTHPETKRKALFVNSIFTTRINELGPGESDAVLGFLFAHVAKPEFHCRFRWRTHSVAFWDNRCVQHMALWDYYPETRSGYRVTIRGDRPA